MEACSKALSASEAEQLMDDLFNVRLTCRLSPSNTPGRLSLGPSLVTITRHLKITRARKSGSDLYDKEGSADDTGVWIQEFEKMVKIDLGWTLLH